MRILVCGGRDFGDLPSRDHKSFPFKLYEMLWAKEIINSVACEFSKDYNPNDNWLPSDITIIHGGARGADRIGDEWAVVNWCNVLEFRADWKTHGKSAGYIRNKKMLDEGKPDLVLAFPGGKGTAMMVKMAQEAGVPVREFKLMGYGGILNNE